MTICELSTNLNEYVSGLSGVKMTSTTKQRGLLKFKSSDMNRHFIRIQSQQTLTNVKLAIPLNQLNDPAGLCKKAPESGSWGSQCAIRTPEELDDLKPIILQAYQYTKRQSN